MTTTEEWAEKLLDVAAGADWGNRPAPQRVVMGNSTIDWSNPCEGILGLEMTRFDYSGEAWPNSSQPQRGPLSVDCADDVWLAGWDVIIVRCADTFEGSPGGAAATPPQLRQSALGLFRDVHAIWTRLRTYPDWNRRHVLVGGYRPLPRQGGASGYVVSVTTKVLACP